MQTLLKFRLLAMFAFIMTSVLFMSAPAYANTIYQGSDYSKSINGNDSGDIRVCDKEIDGHRAYTRFQTLDGNFLTLVDRQGGDSACATHYGFSYILKHQTCETRGEGVGGGDDVCSTYSKHTS